MSALAGDQPGGYRLAGKRVGSALFGLAPPQLLLGTVAVVAAVVLPASTRSPLGLIVGLAVAGVCAAMAFCPVGGQVAYEVVPPVTGYAMRKAAGRSRWAAPLPLLTGTPPSARRGPALRSCAGPVGCLLHSAAVRAVDSLATCDGEVCGELAGSCG